MFPQAQPLARSVMTLTTPGANQGRTGDVTDGAAFETTGKMAVMANDQPDPISTGETTADSRRLRRRTGDRVIGGVAAGVADYLNVDPLLVRAGFAGLMIFGGAGLILYVLAWVLIPAQGREASIVEGLLGSLGFPSRGVGMAIVVFLAVALVGAWMSGYGPGLRYRGIALTGLAIIMIGAVLLRWNDMPWNASTRGASAKASPRQGPESGDWSGPPPQVQAILAQPRERSPLGWYVLAATLIAVGVLAFVANVPGLHVAPAQYFGVTLAVVGLGLVVGAWWGRARRLILLGLLLLPLAVPAAFLTVPLTGGIGDVDFRPQNINELRTEYRITGGDLRLDLTALDTGGEPATITASVGLGRLIVVVPDGTPLQLDAHVAWGGLNLLGNQQYGTMLADRVERPGNRTGPTGPLVLILETGIGGVSVDTAAAQGD